VVSVAMFLTVLIAKSIGCTLPLLASKLHLDPALMASPLITTLVDACSLTILFTIATAVM
jgi:magnesium transporter